MLAFLLAGAAFGSADVSAMETKPSGSLSASEAATLHQTAAKFLKAYCIQCHGADKQAGDHRLDDLINKPFDPEDNKRWQNSLEMVDLGDMPPEKQPQPDEAERQQFIDAIDRLLRSFNVGKSVWEKQLPRYANRVDHEALFSGEHTGPASTPARVWRISGDTYQRRMKDFDLGFEFVVPMKKNDTGFHDYASLYADEATILTMKTNAKRVATAMIQGKATAPPRRGEFDPDTFVPTWSGPKHRQIKDFLEIKGSPTRQQLVTVFDFVYTFITNRQPTSATTERWLDNVFVPHLETGGNEQGLHGTIVAVLLSPDFLFRVELGQGAELADGRRMLSSAELAFALSYTLHNHPVDSVFEAMEKGQLETREDVERVFRALYDDPKLLRGRTAAGSAENVWQVAKDFPRRGTFSRPKLIQFFQQYFEYTKAPDIIKDDLRHGGKHDTKSLVKDADWTVLHILARDQDVLEELLTTDRFAVAEGRRKKKNKLKPGEPNPAMVHGYQEAYNLTAASAQQRTRAVFPMPEGQRAGLLTHPAWLVAKSTNFHTDPVRRGKWILGHLLGYDVPELPIAAQAQLPEWHDKTIRQRFEVVKAEQCWRCHKKMNPLGDPFEAYDDFGRFRTHHFVAPSGAIVETEFETQSRHNPDKEALVAVPKLPVDTGGQLFGTGDPALDGPVADAVELMHKLSRSERVRQVFIRHVFRYFMGRNETLNDSPTLMAMDSAYVESGGSFKETLVALVTSDSFLLRK